MTFTTGNLAIDVLLSIGILVGVFSIGFIVGRETALSELDDPDYSGGL